MAVAASIQSLAGQRRLRLGLLAALLAMGALITGTVAGLLSASGRPTGILLIAAMALPIVIWRSPQAAVVIALLAATMIEQIPVDPVPLKSLPVPLLTDQLPLFTSLNDGVGLSGVLLNPIELLVLLALLVWVLHAALDRRIALPRSPLAVGFLLLFGLALFAEIRGLAAGADLRESLRELRPFVYLGIFYFLAAQLLTRPGMLRVLLWTLVIGSGIKGMQGTLEFFGIRGSLLRPEAILAHEEAVFFGVFLLLTAALWIFDGPSRLRAVATALAPLVLIANVGNSRRSAWLILGAGLIALYAIACVRLQHRRKSLVAGGLLIGGLVGLVYLPLFWNGSGGFSQPARAVRSIVDPDPRDFASNLYRQQEDANLQLNIQRSMPLGAGFGVPIDYALPIQDLTRSNPYLRFVPHNTILYLWMRLGLLGTLAFWWLMGAAFMAACRLARFPDRRLALFGIIAVCALIAYLLEGYYDLGLSWFRIGVFMGCLLGGVEAAGRLSRMSDARVPAARAA
jgi:hypothetical protein